MKTPVSTPSNVANAMSTFHIKEGTRIEPTEVNHLFTPTWTPMELKGGKHPPVMSVLCFEQRRIEAVRRAAWIDDEFPLKQIAECPINVLALDAEQRKLLLIGPTIKVVGEGNVVIRDSVPLRAMLASFQRVHDLIHVKPGLVEIRIQGNMDVVRIKKLLDLFTTDKFLALRAKPVTGDFTRDVFMYQAALYLGIHYTHTNALLDSLCATVTSRLLTDDELDVAVSHIATSNPLIKNISNDLCHLRFKKEISNNIVFEEWLDRKCNEELKDLMTEIDEQHKKRRQAVTKRKCDWRKDPVLLSWGEDIDGVYAVEDEDASNT
jgi:hypothetical protein